MPDQLKPPEEMTPGEAYAVALARIKAAEREQATVLELYDLPLKELPPEIGCLSQLKILHMGSHHTSKTELEALPSEVVQLTQLTVLDLSQNNLSQLPPEICQLTQLIRLVLNQNNLTLLPPEIGHLTQLQELYLRQNSLSQLPPEIGRLTQLRGLYLIDNNLNQLPPEISCLTQLALLDLTHNNLSQLPPEIGCLTRLERLYLKQNNLTQLPPEIGNLTQLGDLDLIDNILSQLPPDIGRLTQLTRLDLGQNNLSQLPWQVGQLIHLVELNLNGNNLSQLPPDIGRLNILGKIDLRGNPKLLLPPEITIQVNHPRTILEYLQQKMSQSHRSLNEAKLVLVGQGGVGKTSLVQRLMHDQHDVNEAQTKGININKWPMSVIRQRGAVEIQLNIWDFGGQEILHATHQFFITKRSLYLLVLDARQGEQEGRVEYWLALINSFAGESPILIVINKTDEHYLDLNRRGLQQKYPNIAGFVRTSARTGQGVDELKQEISRILAGMDHIDTPFPQNWYNIKSELERRQASQNFLPYYEYQKLCQEHGIIHDSSQRVLISFLHDLGVLLNFQEDDRIRDTNILNPAWVTKGVYSLLTHPQLAQQSGVLPRRQLSQLLDATAYPLEVQGFILQMMEKFELAYPFEGGDRYLIPDLLPAEEPPFTWNEAQTLNFEYHYAVLPHSILHRFMVRQHTRIHKQNNKQIVWRTGVMLTYEGLLALIKADIEDKKILISISGSGQRRNFLSMLRFTFDSLHESITGTKPTEQVPIPGHPGVVVPYSHLLVLEGNNIRQQILPGMNEPVNVQMLLGTIEEPSRRQLQGLTRQELFRLLREHFDNEELEAICFELDVRYEDLGGDKNLRKAMGLIEMMERTGRLGELVEAMGRERPFLFDPTHRYRPRAYR
jgi:internalin A